MPTECFLIEPTDTANLRYRRFTYSHDCPTNPGGGTGDEAFIRYYVEGGENTKLLIGLNNDADDDVSFYQAGAERMTIYNGFVGIGTTVPAAPLHLNGDYYSLMGPNSSWGQYLKVGGNGWVSGNASVVTTNGNLHLDAKTNAETYFNWYAGNVVHFGNGAQGERARIDSSGMVLGAGSYQGNGSGLSSLNGSAISSGVVPIAVGGTNATSYTASQFLWFDGTRLVASGYNNGSFAAASGSGNYIQNQNGGAQSANFNISGAGTLGGALNAGGSSNFGTTGQCCAGAYTLGISELTSSNGRLPQIQFHAGGFHEAYIRLRSNERFFQFGDNQSVGVGIGILNGAGTETVRLNGQNGTINTTSTHTGTQFIDRDNNTCYVDPNATSLVQFSVGNKWVARDLGNGDAWLGTQDLNGNGILPGYSPSRYPVLGSSSPNLYLSIQGNYTGYWSTGGYTQVSDERMKTQIHDLTGDEIKQALVDLEGIRTVRFRYKQEVQNVNASVLAQTPLHLGVIAQTLPEGVRGYDPNTSTYGLNTADMLGFLVAAVRGVRAEQKAALADMNARLQQSVTDQATVEALQRAVADRDDQIRQLRTQDLNLQSQIDNRNQEVQALRTQNQRLQTQMDEVLSRLRALESR